MQKKIKITNIMQLISCQKNYLLSCDRNINYVIMKSNTKRN